MYAAQLNVLGNYADIVTYFVHLQTTDGGFELPSGAYCAKGKHYRPCEGWKNVETVIVAVLHVSEFGRVEDTDQLPIRVC